MANEDILALWQMPAHAFNEWRRANDLPELLAFFKQSLPHFDEWQSSHAITDDTFLSATSPSEFFKGTTRKYLASSTGPDFELQRDVTKIFFYDRPISTREFDERQMKDFGTVRYQTNWSIWFTPYFCWLRKTKKLRKFPNPGQPNAFVDDFCLGRTEAYDTIFSRTFLFSSHRLLKLGGVAIRAAQFDNRNLDFVDLDLLRVTGRGSSWETSISYSSCRRMVFKQYTKPFVVFEKSSLEEARFEDCHLERFRFIDGGLSRPRFVNVRMARCELIRCMMWEPTFERCDLVELKVVPPKRTNARYLADCYKRLRVAFQSQGDRREVSRFYFQERFQSMRALAFPIIPGNVPGVPTLAWTDRVSTMYEHWALKRMDRKKIMKLLARNVWITSKILCYPPYLFRFWRYKAKVLPELIDYALWGFGEKPIRIFWWMVVVVAAFTASYYYGINPSLKGNISEAIACSVNNFATVGCSHAGVLDGSIEAIMGMILLGLMVAGFSNRTRY